MSRKRIKEMARRAREKKVAEVVERHRKAIEAPSFHRVVGVETHGSARIVARFPDGSTHFLRNTSPDFAEREFRQRSSALREQIEASLWTGMGDILPPMHQERDLVPVGDAYTLIPRSELQDAMERYLQISHEEYLRDLQGVPPNLEQMDALQQNRNRYSYSISGRYRTDGSVEASEAHVLGMDGKLVAADEIKEYETSEKTEPAAQEQIEALLKSSDVPDCVRWSFIAGVMEELSLYRWIVQGKDPHTSEIEAINAFRSLARGRITVRELRNRLSILTLYDSKRSSINMSSACREQVPYEWQLAHLRGLVAEHNKHRLPLLLCLKERAQRIRQAPSYGRQLEEVLYT